MRRARAWERGLHVGAAVGTLLLTTPSYAQEAIGVASVVRNEVTRGPAGRAVPLGTGESVVRRETVSTGRDSAARIVLIDQTNLSIGPQARIVLDEVVVPSDTARGRAVVNLTEGAFRYVSGLLPKENVEIRTGVATIGIRGTKFSGVTSRFETTITLEEGAIIACARGAPGRCVVLSNAGDTAVITFTSARRGSASASFSFAAAYCSGDPALCTQTTFAERSGGATFAALCGR